MSFSADTPIIDAHHHLWRYTAEEYAWLDEPMAVLQRDFTDADLAVEMSVAQVNGAVAVQARQTMEETRWLCRIAEGSRVIRGVVGWAPIAAPEFPALLEETLRQQPALRGLRHVVQGEPPGFLDDTAFNDGIRALTQSGLTYDLLIFERQMEEAVRFVDRHPHQPFVLDHVGKPRIAAGELEPWRAQLRELARRPNVMCKLSGMVTEADWQNCGLDVLRPYLDACMASFGPRRLMAGSDWPVCLVATSYSGWWKLLREYLAACSETERSAVLGGNAMRFYGLL